MNELAHRVAESLLLPIADIQKWRHARCIAIYKLRGGWRLELLREPAVSAVTAVWEQRRAKLYKDRRDEKVSIKGG